MTVFPAGGYGKVAKSAANMPWSIKGVSQDARALAKKAASERGITIGEWLSEVIRTTDSLAPAPKVVDLGAGETDVASLVLDDDSGDGADFGHESGTPADTELPNVAMTDDLRHRLEDLNRRAEQAEQWALSRAEPLQDAVLRLTRRLERLQSRVRRRLEQEKRIVAGLDVPSGEDREAADRREIGSGPPPGVPGDGVGGTVLDEDGELSSLAKRLAAEDTDWARRRDGEDW